MLNRERARARTCFRARVRALARSRFILEWARLGGLQCISIASLEEKNYCLEWSS